MFSITGTLQLQGVQNLNQIANQIKQQLGNLNIQLNLQLSPQAQSQLNQTKQALNQTQTAANRTASAMNNVASAANRAGTAVGAATKNFQSFNVTMLGMNRTTGQLNQRFEESGTAIENFARQAGLAARRFIAFSVAAGAVVKLFQEIQNGIGQAVIFERELVRIAQLGSATNSEIQSLSQEVSRLASSLGTSSQELVIAARVLKQAGLSATETKDALEALARAAVAPNFAEMTSTVEAAIAAMRQFNIPANQMLQTLGSINAVASDFAVDAADISEAIKRAGGAFASAGGNVEELIALFTSVRATTRESAASIATGLRTIFTRIQRESTVSALRELGIQIRRTREEALALGNVNLTGQFVGAYEAIRRISEGLKSIPTTDPRFSRVIEEIGGFRQVSRVIPLIREVETRERSLNTARAGGISLVTASDKAQESLLVRVTALQEKFAALFRDITSSDQFKQLADAFVTFGDAVAYVVDKLKPLIPLLGLIATTSIARNLTTIIPNFGKTFFGGPGNGGGGGVTRPSSFAFASGGRVPGVGNRDSVLANVMPGEFVVRKDAVRNADRVAPGFLDNLNQSGIPRFASGGPVQITPPGGNVLLAYLGGGAANSLAGNGVKNVAYSLRELYSGNNGNFLRDTFGGSRDQAPPSLSGEDLRTHLTDAIFGGNPNARRIPAGLVNSLSLAQRDRLVNAQQFDRPLLLGNRLGAPLSKLSTDNLRALNKEFSSLSISKLNQARAKEAGFDDSRFSFNTQVAIPFLRTSPAATKTANQERLKQLMRPVMVRLATSLFGPLPGGRNANNMKGQLDNIVDNSLAERTLGSIFEAAVNAYRGSAPETATQNFDITPSDTGSEYFQRIFGTTSTGKYGDFKLSLNPKAFKDTARKAVSQFGVFNSDRVRTARRFDTIRGGNRNASFRPQQFADGGIVQRIKNLFGLTQFELNNDEVLRSFNKLDKRAGGAFTSTGIGRFALFNNSDTGKELLPLLRRPGSVDSSPEARDRSIASITKSVEGAAGFYGILSRNILLNKDRITSRKQLDYVLAHELGHAFDAHALYGSGAVQKPYFASRQPGTVASQVAEQRKAYLGPETLATMAATTSEAYANDPTELFANATADFLTKRHTRARKGQNDILKALFKVVPQFATGGLNSGEVPALLTPGEVVLRPEVVQRQGAGRLMHFNKTGDPSVLKFHSGGIVPGYQNGTNSLGGTGNNTLVGIFNTLANTAKRLDSAFQTTIAFFTQSSGQFKRNRALAGLAGSPNPVLSAQPIPTGTLQRTANSIGAAVQGGVQKALSSPLIGRGETPVPIAQRNILNQRDAIRLAGGLALDEVTGVKNAITQFSQQELSAAEININSLGKQKLIRTEAEAVRRLQPKLTEEQANYQAILNINRAAGPRGSGFASIVTGSGERKLIGTTATANSIRATGQDLVPPEKGTGIRGFFGIGAKGATPEQRAAFAQRSQIASLAVLGVLPYIQQFVSSNTGTADTAIATGTEGSFRRGQQVSGLLGGATLGGSLGSVFGVKGIAVGAVVGAAVGLANSFSDAEKQLKEAKLDIGFRQLGVNLSRFGEQLRAGKDIETVVGNINQQVAGLQQDILEASAASVGTFSTRKGAAANFLGTRERLTRERFGGQVGSLQSVLAALVQREIRGGASRQDAVRNVLNNQNGIVQAIAGVNNGGNTTAARADIETAIITEAFGTELRRSTEVVRNFAGSFSVAINEFTSNLSEQQQSISNFLISLDPSKIGNIRLAGANLNAPGTTAFQNDIIALTQSLGPGGANLGTAGLAAANIAQNGANVVRGALTSGLEADALREALQSGFNQLVGDNRIGRQIAESVATSIAALTAEQRDSALINPTGALNTALGSSGFRELQQVFQGLADVNQNYVNTTVTLQSAINNTRDRIVALGNVANGLSDRFDTLQSSISLRREGRGNEALDIINRPARAEALFQSSQASILGRPGVGVASLSAQLNQSIARRNEIQAQLPNASGASLANLNNEFTTLQTNIGNFTRALENYANVQERNKSISEELNRLGQREVARRNVAESLLTSDRGQLRDVRRGFERAVNVADTGGDVTQLPLRIRRQIFQALQTLGPTQVFGGRNVQDIRNRVLGGAGFQGLNVQNEGERRNLEDQLLRNFQDAQNATRALTETQQGIFRNLGDRLEQINQRFLQELRTLLIRSQTLPLETERGQQQQRLAQLNNARNLAQGARSAGFTSQNLNEFLSNPEQTRQRLTAFRNAIGAFRGTRTNNLTADTQFRSEITNATGLFSGAGARQSAIVGFLQRQGVDTNRLAPDQLARISRPVPTGVGVDFAGNLSPEERAQRRSNAVTDLVLARIRRELRVSNAQAQAETTNVGQQLGLNQATINQARSTGGEALIRQLQDLLNAREQFRGANGEFSFETLDTSVNTLNASIAALTAQINALNNNLPRANTQPPALLSTLSGLGTGIGNIVGPLAGFATGGPVSGSGAGDSVPAMLTPGEFVVNRNATRNNLQLLQAMNAQRFALGGLVRDGSPEQQRRELLFLAQAAPSEQTQESVNTHNAFFGTNFRNVTEFTSGVLAARRRLGFARGTTGEQILEYEERRRARDGENWLEQDAQRLAQRDLARFQRPSEAVQRQIAARTEARAAGQQFGRAIAGINFGRRVSQLARRRFGRTGAFSGFSFVGDQTQNSFQARADSILQGVQDARESGDVFGLPGRAPARRPGVPARPLVNPLGAAAPPPINPDNPFGVQRAAGLNDPLRAPGLPGRVDPNRPFGFATGGLVSGSGAGDSVPALLTPNEFVLNRDAVRNIGVQNLQRMNEGGIVGQQQSQGVIPNMDFGPFLEASNQLREVFTTFNNNISRLSDAFGLFNTTAQQLAEALSQMPTSIELQGTHTVEVIINGAEVMTSLQPELAKLVEAKTKEVLSNFVKDKLPDLGDVN